MLSYSKCAAVSSAASLLLKGWEAAVALSVASAMAHVLPAAAGGLNFHECGIPAAHSATLMQAEQAEAVISGKLDDKARVRFR